MKRIIAITLTLLMVFSLFACNKGGSDTTTENSNPSESTSAEASSTDASASTTEADSTTQAADPSNLEAGSEGAGPVELKTDFFNVKVPEKMSYEVSSYYVDESNPLFGSIEIKFRNEKKYIIATLKATTQNMVKSKEEAVENTIDLCNLDTYKNGASATEGKDAKYGENTFSTINVKTEFYEKDFYVDYVKRGDNDSKGLLVKLEVNLGSTGVQKDDPIIKEILSSLSIVMEK